MSEKQDLAAAQKAGDPEAFYPPPPPGPPPSQQAPSHQVPHQAAPQHTNDVPLPDEKHPGWNASQRTDSDLYDSDLKPTAQGQQHAPAAGHAQKPSWSDRLSALGTKAAAPFNALAEKMGSESFLPTTMDKESEKAARILRSFCKDGIYTDTTDSVPLTTGEVAKPKLKSKSILTIPSKVIARAVGLAIYTTGRVGYGVSGSSGSGILIARLPDGRWSPPSGIQIHSIGGGFVMGLDIYDCVIVINTKEALKAFTRTRASLGSDIAVSAGPYGAGGVIDFAAPESKDKGKTKDKKGEQVVDDKTAPAAAVPAEATNPGAVDPKKEKTKFAPVFSYVKSRGLYAGVQIDGTVVTERKDANAAFYGSRVTVEQILEGKVPSSGAWQVPAAQLHAVIKGAEGAHGGKYPASPAVEQQHMMSPAGGAGQYFPPPPGTTGTAGYTRAEEPTAPTPQMQQLHVGDGHAPAGQVPMQGAPLTKEQEAAAEASGVHRSNTRATMLPAYSVEDPTGAPAGTAADAPGAAPPAYVDDGVAPPTDQKSGTGQ